MSNIANDTPDDLKNKLAFKLKKRYKPVLNIKSLQQENFSSFWYSTGTPRFLTDIIKNRLERYSDHGIPEIGDMPAAP